MGLMTPWSHVPNTLVPYDEKMSFTERWYNSLFSFCDMIVRSYMYFPRQNELARKYFGHLGAIPTIEELTKNISLVLLNTHRSVQSPRPSMPTILNIGGAHIKDPKPLPGDLQKFLDESTNGAIYFSLGTVLKTSQMPKEKLQIILGMYDGNAREINRLSRKKVDGVHFEIADALKMIKYNVIWKYEDDKAMANRVSSNVIVRKWLPQSDILAHKNVRLFISHAGMFSNFEVFSKSFDCKFVKK